MNRKVLIIGFLLVHLLVHPLVHISALADAPGKTTVTTAQDRIPGIDDCGLCRVSTNLVLLAVVALITAAVVATKPRVWDEPLLRSTEISLQLPSRAPPAFA